MVKAIALLIGEDDDSAMLGTRQRAKVIGRVQHFDEIRGEDLPEAQIELHGEAIVAWSLASGHPLKGSETLLHSKEALTGVTGVTGQRR